MAQYPVGEGPSRSCGEAHEGSPACALTTNRGSRSAASCILKPRPRRSARYSCTASRRAFIAHLPATAEPGGAARRYPPGRKSRWSVGFDAEELRRSRSTKHSAAANALPGRGETGVTHDAVRPPRRAGAHGARSCRWHLSPASIRESAPSTVRTNAGRGSGVAPAADRRLWPPPRQRVWARRRHLLRTRRWLPSQSQSSSCSAMIS